eukprot:gene39596-63314_t
MTNAALDPVGKIPEFKYCAVAIRRGGVPAAVAGYGTATLNARAPLTREVLAVNELGQTDTVSIPAERALTVYVDKRELVTLMTLGAQPELLVLGFLRNQRLVQSPDEVASITVDWDVQAAAVQTRAGIADIEARTSRRVVTTGCGQGSVFGALMDDVGSIQLPPARLTQA